MKKVIVSKIIPYSKIVFLETIPWEDSFLEKCPAAG